MFVCFMPRMAIRVPSLSTFAAAKVQYFFYIRKLFVQKFYFCNLHLLFPPKIRRYFAPCFRIPLINRRSPCVIVQPHFCLSDHVKKVLIGGVPFDFGFAAPLSEPCQRRDAIGINNPREVVFLDIRQAQHQRQEFADVIRSLYKRSSMEDLGARIRDDTSEFHHTGITATGGIHSQGR